MATMILAKSHRARLSAPIIYLSAARRAPIAKPRPTTAAKVAAPLTRVSIPGRRSLGESCPFTGLPHRTNTAATRKHGAAVAKYIAVSCPVHIVPHRKFELLSLAVLATFPPKKCPLLCRFSDACMTIQSARAEVRRRKSAKARNRGSGSARLRSGLYGDLSAEGIVGTVDWAVRSGWASFREVDEREVVSLRGCSAGAMSQR
jgi:hypothetical protein